MVVMLNSVQQTTAIAEKTVRLFLSSKPVVYSNPVNKPCSISPKTVVFLDNLPSMYCAIAVGCCTILWTFSQLKVSTVTKHRHLKKGLSFKFRWFPFKQFDDFFYIEKNLSEEK